MVCAVFIFLFTYFFNLGQNRVAYRKSASWDHPQWVKSNSWRAKEREKVSVNNGQVNRLDQNSIWLRNLIQRVLYRTKLSIEWKSDFKLYFKDNIAKGNLALKNPYFPIVLSDCFVCSILSVKY